jgi:hypothetical protein
MGGLLYIQIFSNSQKKALSANTLYPGVCHYLMLFPSLLLQEYSQTYSLFNSTLFSHPKSKHYISILDKINEQKLQLSHSPIFLCLWSYHHFNLISMAPKRVENSFIFTRRSTFISTFYIHSNWRY